MCILWCITREKIWSSVRFAFPLSAEVREEGGRERERRRVGGERERERERERREKNHNMTEKIQQKSEMLAKVVKA